MPLFRKNGSPFWWYDFRAGGRRYRGSTKEKTLAAARNCEAQLLLKVEAGDTPALRGKAPTLRVFSERFLAYFNAHQQRDEDSKRYYRRGVTLLLNTKLANMPIDQITTSVVATVSFPHSPATGNNALRTLGRCLSQAVEWGLLRNRPKIALFKELAREITFTPDIEKIFLSKAPQPLRDVFLVIMDTGMRPEEVCRLRTEHISWERNTLLVSHGKSRDSRRHIGMSERLREVLKARIAAFPDSQWIFPSKRAKSGHIYGVNKAYLAVRRNLGLSDDLVLYSARHTFGTDLMMGTGNPKLVMQVMGHRDLKTSARYQHPSTAGISTVLDKRNALRSKEISVTPFQDGHTFGHSTNFIQ